MVILNSNDKLSFDSKKCSFCDLLIDEISSFLGICLSCLKNTSKLDEKLEMIKKIHATSRKRLKLPLYRPNDPDGVKCHLCSAECSIGSEKMS